MPETYFDAVLDDRMMPVFNGTAEETLAWLKENPDAHNLRVCVGKTMDVIPVKRYIENAGRP